MIKLSKRELDVVRCILLYKQRWRRSPTLKEIAHALNIDEATVHVYISRIIRKGFATRFYRKRQIFIVPKGTYILTQKHITYKPTKTYKAVT